MKTCSRCKQTKDSSAFNKDRSRKDGLFSYCRECKSLSDKEYIAKDYSRKDKRLVRSAQWRKDNPERARQLVAEWKTLNKDRKDGLDKKSHLWTHYRLTPERFEQMKLRQHNKCAICGLEKKLVVDHDHRCCPGKISCGECVRSLLCYSCNTLVGYVECNPKLMEKVIKYID